MAQIHWLNPVDGDFGDASDWSGGVVPGSGDGAILDASGAPYTVTMSQAETVFGIQTTANVTLTGADLTVKAGTGSVSNAGTIVAGYLDIQGSVINSGAIEVEATFKVGNTTISGGGSIMLDTTNSYLVGGTVTNVDNTITGFGTISATLTNDKAGIIDATGTTYPLKLGARVIQIANYGLIETTGAAGMLIRQDPITNFGTIEANGSGALTIFQGQITNYGGEVEVTKGSTLVDYGIGFITGGTIDIAAGAALVCGDLTSPGNGAFIGASTFVNAGIISVPSYAFLDTAGTITNSGTLALNASGHSTYLFIPVGYGLTLDGGGKVTLTDDSNNLIAVWARNTRPSATLTNVDNTVTGAGTIGNGVLSVVNQAKGVIDGSGTNNVLKLDVGATFTNAGLIESTGAAGMVVSGGTITNSGVIEAIGAGALTVEQATIASAAGGLVSVGKGAMLLLGDGGEISGGVVSGAGTLDLGPSSGIAAITLGASLRLSVANAALAGAGTTVTVADSLAYAGKWTQSAGTVSVSSGDWLGFAGASNSFAGTIAGAGTVAFTAGRDTLAGTSLTATHVNLSGAAVTLSGAIANASAVALDAGKIVVATGGASLTGTGTFLMNDGAASLITGATAASTLIVGQVLEGAGKLGAGQMTLVVQTVGKIEALGANALTIDTGTSAIVNAGKIFAAGPGGVTILSAIDNAGFLIAASSTLTVNGAVTGTGLGWVNSGTLKFTAASSFNQHVNFVGAGGTLELAHGQTYSGAITGFSLTGATKLDLDDIAFIAGTTKATYSGTTASGVLTVTDGTHAAHIHFTGNYTASTWTLSAGPVGGTQIVDPTKVTPGAAPRLASPILSTQTFVQAMAGMEERTAAIVGVASESRRPPLLTLTSPKAQIA